MTDGYWGLPADQRAIWEGTYPGMDVPSIWQQQAQAAAQPAAAPTQQYQFLGNYPASMGGGTVAPSNPWTIGAGTTGVQYGYGVPRPGADLIKIDPSYLGFLGTQATGQRGGYIPGSGSYLGWQLDKPGLLATIGGVPNQLTTWGSGAAGDPAGVAGQPQTPQQWVQAPRLFSWEGMMTGAQGPIASLFGRSDTPSGISTDALNAPAPYWQELYSQIASGRVKPSASGWQFLQSVKGVTPQQIGGQAPALAQATGTAGGAGTGGAGTNAAAWLGVAGGDQEMANALANIAASGGADQAAQLAFTFWRMRSGDETLAQSKAQQAWTQTYTQQQADRAQAVAAAGLTGQYEGQQTQQAQQQAFAQDLANRTLAESQLQNRNATGLSLLSQQSALQGPRDWAKYWQLSASAPEGLRSALGSLAGQYQFAPGAQGTPGPATLQSRTQDLLGPTAGAGAAAAGAPTGGAAANPWQFNLQNWSRMNPSMQQGVLGGLEAGGMYGPDVEAMLRAAAPRYAGPAGAQVQA